MCHPIVLGLDYSMSVYARRRFCDLQLAHVRTRQFLFVYNYVPKYKNRLCRMLMYKRFLYFGTDWSTRSSRHTMGREQNSKGGYGCMALRGLLRKFHGNVQNANGARAGDGATGIVLCLDSKKYEYYVRIIPGTSTISFFSSKLMVD